MNTVQKKKKEKKSSRDNNLPPANFAARNSCSQIACFECLWVWWSKHIVTLDCCQPVAECCGVVVTPSMTMTFNEWIRSELFETGTWRDQGLAAALCSRISVHEETVARPNAVPAFRALRYFQSLTVYGYDLRGRLADAASTDVFLDVSSHNWCHCHGHWFRSAEPVAVVVPRREVANIIQAAEQERHRAESAQAASGASQVLAMGFLIPKNIEERIARPERVSSSGTFRNSRSLAVPGEEVPSGPGRTTRSTTISWTSRSAWLSGEAW